MHRLRDLDRRGRVVAVVVVLALAAPFVASVVRAVDVGWTPSNDEALITLRVHDVLQGELPLVGQPSTAEQYADTDPPHHPGPIEFYLLVPFVLALGSDVGVLVGAGAVNLAAVLVAAWVLFRRAGPAVGLGGAVVLSGVAWAQGTAVLSDPISSNIGGIPILALAVLAWAVVDGDIRLLPLTAFAFAFVFQQHLAVVGVSTGLALWAGLGLLLAVLAWRARNRDRDRSDPAAEPVRPWPWVLAAAVVSLVAWLPVLVDQIAGTGNLGRMATFARSSDRPTLGYGSGLRQALRSVGAPPLLLRTNLTGDDIHAPFSVLGAVAALATVAALVAVVVVDRRRCRARAALAATALVLAVLGGVNGSNVPDSVEAARINFYRWSFVASALAWSALGWAVAGFVRRRLASGAPARWTAPVGGLLVAGLLSISLLTITSSGPRARRDEPLFDHEHAIAERVLDAVEGADRVLLVPDGAAAILALGPALAVDLVEAGHEIGVPATQEPSYGDHLVASGRFDAGVVVSTRKGPVPSGPGRVIARIDLNEATADARARLADQLRGRELVVSPRADEVLHEVLGSATSGQAVVFALLLRDLADRPEEVLLDPYVGRALQAGYLTAPVLDREALDLLAAHPPRDSWGDDHIEVRVLTPAEVAAHGTELTGSG